MSNKKRSDWKMIFGLSILAGALGAGTLVMAFLGTLLARLG